MAQDHKESSAGKYTYDEPINIRDVHDPDRQVTRSFPAIWVTAFQVETGGPTVRITFGEGRADVRELVRAALVMPKGDAISLARVIQKLFKDEFDKPTDPDKEEIIEEPARPS